MANSKIIVVEGPQGAGKTTYTDFLRATLPYTNLYRLCGTSDITAEGKRKATEMYDDLLEYIKKMENKSINLVFDRTFFTEEIYCRLGKKEYSFTDVYDRLLDEFAKMDFDIYYITLYLGNTDDYIARLNRPGKAVYKGSEFDLQNSIGQQEAYLNMAKEINEKYPNINIINVDTCQDLDVVKKEIREKIGY